MSRLARLLVSIVVIALSAPAAADPPPVDSVRVPESPRGAQVVRRNQHYDVHPNYLRVFASPGGLVMGEQTIQTGGRAQPVVIVCAPTGGAVSCAGFDRSGASLPSVRVTRLTPRGIVFDAGDGVSHTVPIYEGRTERPVPPLAPPDAVRRVYPRS